jgi:hypothetical protein
MGCVTFQSPCIFLIPFRFKAISTWCLHILAAGMKLLLCTPGTWIFCIHDTSMLFSFLKFFLCLRAFLYLQNIPTTWLKYICDLVILHSDVHVGGSLVALWEDLRVNKKLVVSTVLASLNIYKNFTIKWFIIMCKMQKPNQRMYSFLSVILIFNTEF